MPKAIQLLILFMHLVKTNKSPVNGATQQTVSRHQTSDDHDYAHIKSKIFKLFNKESSHLSPTTKIFKTKKVSVKPTNLGLVGTNYT